MRRHLSYANVTATLALFVALGGGAYAVSHVGSGDIKDNSVRSLDLKDRHGVKGRDVARNGLGGAQIDEHSLNAAKLVQISGGDSSSCDPNSSTQFTTCVETSVRLRRSARVLAIATGGQESSAGAASALCEIQFDGAVSPLASTPGEAVTGNTSAAATNGFARTEVSDLLTRGHHEVALVCKESSPNVKIDDATIAAIAVNEPK